MVPTEMEMAYKKNNHISVTIAIVENTIQKAQSETDL